MAKSARQVIGPCDLLRCLPRRLGSRHTHIGDANWFPVGSLDDVTGRDFTTSAVVTLYEVS